MFLQNNPKENMHADWFKIVFLQLGRNTELTQTVDIMSKENLLKQ